MTWSDHFIAPRYPPGIELLWHGHWRFNSEAFKRARGSFSNSAETLRRGFYTCLGRRKKILTRTIYYDIHNIIHCSFISTKGKCSYNN